MDIEKTFKPAAVSHYRSKVITISFEYRAPNQFAPSEPEEWALLVANHLVAAMENRPATKPTEYVLEEQRYVRMSDDGYHIRTATVRATWEY